jgi:predicted ester cyclase
MNNDKLINGFSKIERDNIALVKRFVKEVLNERSEQAEYKILSPDIIFHYEHDKIIGIDRWKEEHFDVLINAIPDLSLDIDDIIAHGDNTVTRWTARGTHLNELFGVSPSNEIITITGMDWTKIVDNKFVENWNNWDMSYLVGQMRQELNTLRGILPLCSFCKKIRNDKGYWEQVDVYIHKYSEVDISHSICPDCMKKHYREEHEDMYLTEE